MLPLALIHFACLDARQVTPPIDPFKDPKTWAAKPIFTTPSLASTFQNCHWSTETGHGLLHSPAPSPLWLARPYHLIGHASMSRLSDALLQLQTELDPGNVKMFFRDWHQQKPCQEIFWKGYSPEGGCRRNDLYMLIGMVTLLRQQPLKGLTITKPEGRESHPSFQTSLIDSTLLAQHHYQHAYGSQYMGCRDPNQTTILTLPIFERAFMVFDAVTFSTPGLDAVPLYDDRLLKGSLKLGTLLARDLTDRPGEKKKKRSRTKAPKQNGAVQPTPPRATNVTTPAVSTTPVRTVPSTSTPPVAQPAPARAVPSASQPATVPARTASTPPGAQPTPSRTTPSASTSKPSQLTPARATPTSVAVQPTSTPSTPPPVLTIPSSQGFNQEAYARRMAIAAEITVVKPPSTVAPPKVIAPTVQARTLPAASPATPAPAQKPTSPTPVTTPTASQTPASPPSPSPPNTAGPKQAAPTPAIASQRPTSVAATGQPAPITTTSSTSQPARMASGASIEQASSVPVEPVPPSGGEKTLVPGLSNKKLMIIGSGAILLLAFFCK